MKIIFVCRDTKLSAGREVTLECNMYDKQKLSFLVAVVNVKGDKQL